MRSECCGRNKRRRSLQNASGSASLAAGGGRDWHCRPAEGPAATHLAWSPPATLVARARPATLNDPQPRAGSRAACSAPALPARPPPSARAGPSGPAPPPPCERLVAARAAAASGPAAGLPGFLGSSSPTGGRTVAGFSLAPRSPFLATVLDDFWVPGRGALGEAPGALVSPDMWVQRLRGPHGGRGGGTGGDSARGGRTRGLYSASSRQAVRSGVASASFSTTTARAGRAGGRGATAERAGADAGRRQLLVGGAGRPEVEGAGEARRAGPRRPHANAEGLAQAPSAPKSPRKQPRSAGSRPGLSGVRESPGGDRASLWAAVPASKERAPGRRRVSRQLPVVWGLR